jgi:hypothetical protein
MRTYLACIALLGVAICGCSHTVVGGSADSQDKRYHLWISSHGASAKAYVDKSKKKIWVTGALFQQRYDLTGSDIQWDIRWSSNNSVSVVFYDWGDGVSNYNDMKHLPASNHIASLSFALDPTTGKFIETK